MDESANVFVTANSWGDDSNDFTTLRYSPVTSAVDLELPSEAGARLVVHAPWPNPFNPSTTISYEMPSAGEVQVAIFDVGGRLVRTLFDGQQDAGFNSMPFDGRDDAGSRLAFGIYHVQVTTEDLSATQKLVLLK